MWPLQPSEARLSAFQQARTPFHLLPLLIASAALVCAAPEIAPWTYHSDFAHGLTGWMSYPLSQDIGFDPTISVEKTDTTFELIRELTRPGGVIRPMHFLAAPDTRVSLTYKAEFSTAAAPAHLHLLLAAEDGHRYQTDLPATTAPHHITLTGRQLGLPNTHTPIEAVLLEGNATRLTLHDIEIAASHGPPAAPTPITIQPAGPHPRTLLSAERLRQLKPTIGKQIHDRAQKSAQLETNPSAGANIQHLLPGRSLRAEYDGELTPYFQLLDSYGDAISTCALDYVINADRASFDAAKRNLLAVSQWPTWTPPRFTSHGIHTYYETGVFAQKVAFGYDLIANELTQPEKDEVASAFWRNVINPTLDEYVRYDRMPLAASNWMANSVGGALIAAIVTEGDIDGWRNREGAAVTQLTAAYQQCLRSLFPGDGSELEPIGYQHFAMQGFSWGAAALASIGIRPPELDRMYASYAWPRYAMVRPNLMLDGGDFDGDLKNFDGFAYAAEHSNLPGVRALYDLRPNRAPSPLDLVCCTKLAPYGPSVNDAPLSRIFEHRGSAVLRSAWDTAAAVISLRAGPWFNHEHHDQGSFQVAAFGDRIISEAGYAHYYRDPNYPTYFTQASGHNTVVIDDDPFSQQASSGGFWRALDNHRARIVSHLFSPQFDYLDTDLTGAYDDKLSTYHRRFLYLRPDVLVIFDDLRAPQAHVFSWLLHAAEGTMPSVSGDKVHFTTSHAEADIHGSAPWQMKTAPLPITVFSDLNRGPIQDRYILQLHSDKSREAHFTVSLHIRPRGEQPAPTSDWTAAARLGRAPIRAHNLEADAQFLATRSDNYLAIGATSISRGPKRLLTSTAPLDVACARSANETIYDIVTPAPATVTIGSTVHHLAKGEHHVRVRDGSSL